MNKLTPVDQHVFEHIVAFDFRFQRMPTRKELCFYTGVCHGQINRHMDRLVEAGKLQKLPLGTLDYAIINPERNIDSLPEQLSAEGDL